MYWNADGKTLGEILEMINFNMGCIETEKKKYSDFLRQQINFNMGCIETIR